MRGWHRRGSYGIDAPWVFLALGCFALANLALAVYSHKNGPLIAAVMIGLCLASWWHATRRGKFVVWAQLLDELQLRGDERVLDLGCGRGAVLLMVAERLDKGGRAIGADIWSGADQSGNGMAATESNAHAEGVAERIELHTADMRELPFPDASMDLIVSSLAIHNIPDAAGRDRAIAEALRVLRPGGRLRIADIFSTKRYVQKLTELGAHDVQRRNLGWRLWWGGPFRPTHLVSARKPRVGGEGA